MEGRIQQPDGDRQAVHGLEEILEVARLYLLEVLQGLGVDGGVVAQNQPAHERQAVLGEEHVLGPAQPDALGAEYTGVTGARAVVHVGPNAEPPGPDAVGPAEEGLHLGRRRRGLHGAGAHEDLAPVAVDGDDLTGSDPAAVDDDAVFVHEEGFHPDHRGDAPPARHDGCVAGQSTAPGHQSGRGLHSQDILGSGLRADEDGHLAVLGGVDGRVGAEGETARRRSGRSGDPGAEQFEPGCPFEMSVEEVGHVGGRDRGHRVQRSEPGVRSERPLYGPPDTPAGTVGPHDRRRFTGARGWRRRRDGSGHGTDPPCRTPMALSTLPCPVRSR